MKENRIPREQQFLQSLISCAHSIQDSLSFTEAAQSIYTSCSELIGSTAGYVALATADQTANNVLFFDMGELSCSLNKDIPVPISGLSSDAYRSKKIVYANNFQESEWVYFLPEGHGRLENVLFAPIVVDDKAVGIIGLANKPGGFDADATALRAP